MDSSDEEGGRLAFAVTQDDLEEEADAFAAQRKRRRTKDDAIYGIFADDDQPSDDDGAGRRGGRAPRGRSSLAASRPMAFVAGEHTGGSSSQRVGITAHWPRSFSQLQTETFVVQF